MITTNQSKEKMLHVKLPDDWFRQFKALCSLNGITMSRAIREHIRDAIGQQEETKA